MNVSRPSRWIFQIFFSCSSVACWSNRADEWCWLLQQFKRSEMKPTALLVSAAHQATRALCLPRICRSIDRKIKWTVFGVTHHFHRFDWVLVPGMGYSWDPLEFLGLGMRGVILRTNIENVSWTERFSCCRWIQKNTKWLVSGRGNKCSRSTHKSCTRQSKTPTVHPSLPCSITGFSVMSSQLQRTRSVLSGVLPTESRSFLFLTLNAMTRRILRVQISMMLGAGSWQEIITASCGYVMQSCLFLLTNYPCKKNEGSNERFKANLNFY